MHAIEKEMRFAFAAVSRKMICALIAGLRVKEIEKKLSVIQQQIKMTKTF